jgi:hypothetical protein
MADNGKADHGAQGGVKSGGREGSRDHIASKETTGSTRYATINLILVRKQLTVTGLRQNPTLS